MNTQIIGQCLLIRATKAQQKKYAQLFRRKKTIRGFSSREDEIFNRKLSSDRIIVENYFDRLGKLWGILGTKFRWSESLFDTIFAIGIALTNYHVTMHKLRDLDGPCYTRTVTDWYKSGRKKAKTCGSSVKVSCWTQNAFEYRLPEFYLGQRWWNSRKSVVKKFLNLTFDSWIRRQFEYT